MTETETQKKGKLPADPKPRAQLEMPPGIPVAVLRFLKPTQYPGHAVSPIVKTELAKNRRRWEVEFIPQIRHFKISYFAPDTDKVEIVMLHETRVDNWDPVL